MTLLVPSILILLVCYFTMRYLKLYWEKRKLPQWSRYFLGALAWGTLLGFSGFSASVLVLLFLIIRDGEMGAIFGLMSLAMGTGLLAKYANANPELFDYEAMKPFLKDSLAFSDPSRKTENIFIELDRHEVRRVYREVTGKELATSDETDEFLSKRLASTAPTSFSGDTVINTPQTSMEILKQPIASPHLTGELDQIRRGMDTDVSDSWKINSLKRASHDFFHFIARVRFLTAEKTLDIGLESEQFSQVQLSTATSLYRFKRDLYEFLLAVNDEPWTESYRRHARIITCTCSGVEVDAFKGRSVRPMLKVEISLKELVDHSKGFFNAGDLKTTLLG